MVKNSNRGKRKNIAMNLILFAILFLSVSFNKEYIRPIFANKPFLGILTGSFSNFMAAYIISLFPIAAIIAKKINVKKGRFIFYIVALFVFIALTFEEITPFVNASKVYDIYDIIASAIGAIFAIITFEIIMIMKKSKL
jgi:hypothetical protein